MPEDDSNPYLEGYGTSEVSVPTLTYGRSPSSGLVAQGAQLGFGKSTVTQAVANYAAGLTTGDPIAQYITQQLFGAGAIKANSSAKQMVSAYQAALVQTARINLGGNDKANWLDGLSFIAKPGGTATGGGTSKIKYFTTYSDEQVSQRAKSAYTAVLGREPSDAEIKAFGKALRAGAKAAPAIQKTSASGGTQTSQKGFDETAFIAGYMANHIPDPNEDLDGVAGQVQDLIDQYKENYGIKPSQSFVSSAIKSIVGSDDPTAAKANLEQQMKEQAQILFPALTDKINAGLSVRAIADPFISTYSKLMEENDMNIGLDNQTISQALSNKNDKGEYQLMDIDSFARSIRSKDEWLNTKNAKETMLGAADGILKQFGFRR